MSLKFMEMVAEINSRRYLRQMQNLAISKIPCGFFVGFIIPPNVLDALQSLQKFGVNLTYIIVPSDEFKKFFDEIALPVITLMDLPKSTFKITRMLYIASSFLENVFHYYFKRYGIETLPIQEFKATENQFDFHMKYLPELYSVYEMFSDEESKAVYRAFITGKLTGRISDYKFAPESQYFLEGFLPSEGDIAIDGGAYDGATSRDFAMQGAKVYAFEMSAQNYKKCLARSQKYNFVAENIGLSNREGTDTYKDYGVGASKGGGVLKQQISSTLTRIF